MPKKAPPEVAGYPGFAKFYHRDSLGHMLDPEETEEAELSESEEDGEQEEDDVSTDT